MEALGRALPPHDEAVIKRSTTLGGLGRWRDQIELAVETPEARVLCFATSAYDIQILVEPLHGDVRAACDTLWTAVHKSGAAQAPELRSLTVIDDTSGREVATAGVGFSTGLVARRDLWLALTTALATMLVVLIAAATSGSQTTATVAIGAIPGVLAGAIALGVLIKDSKDKRLVWRA